MNKYWPLKRIRYRYSDDVFLYKNNYFWRLVAVLWSLAIMKPTVIYEASDENKKEIMTT